MKKSKNLSNKRFLLFVLFLFMSLISFNINAQISHNVYWVGHSIFSPTSPNMVDDVAQDAGDIYTFDLQLTWGACLAQNWDGHATPSYGSDSWIELPTGNYDVFLMVELVPIWEAIPGSWSPCHYRSDSSMAWFYNMAQSANPQTQTYLVESWTDFDLNSPTTHQDWLDSNAANGPLVQATVNTVNQKYPGYNPICILPLRQAVEVFVDSVRAGVIPGITNWDHDLFETVFDPPTEVIHANEILHYFASLVYYSAIYRQSPVGVSNQTYDDNNFPYDAPTPAAALKMQEIAWDVVSNYQSPCNPITSVAEMENKTELDLMSVYPNPTTDLLTISLNNEVKSTDGVLVIENIYGQIVSEEKINLNIKQQQVDMSSHANGTYVVKLMTPEGVQSIKIIKQ